MADYYSQGPVGGAPPPNNTSGAHNEFPSNNVPAYPGWLKFLLIPIFLFTVCVLGLVGYVAAMLKSGSDSIGFNIFTVCIPSPLRRQTLLKPWLLKRTIT